MNCFYASASKIDLQPPVGGWMTGFAARTEPSQGTHDPIMAHAVLLSDGESKLAIVSCDLLGFAPDAVSEIRRMVAAKSSIKPGNILISCTHTHSGPTSLPMRGVLNYQNGDWLQSAQAAIADQIVSLESGLMPAKIKYSSTMLSGIGFNRQDESHPNDEELLVIAVDSNDGKPIATVMNYATHAVVLGGRYMYYSADFPGVAMSEIERLRGGVGIYLQGACGDVNPACEMRGDFSECERLGGAIAEAAFESIGESKSVDDICIKASSKTVDVPLDPAPTLDELEEIISANDAEREKNHESGNKVRELIAQTMIDWAIELKEKIETNSVSKTIPAEVFAARIGSLRIVTLPFETYTDIGLGIKDGLRLNPTVFAGYSNGLFGYCPTDRAKDQGGYGPADSYRWFGLLSTSVGYGAADLLVKESVALAKTL